MQRTLVIIALLAAVPPAAAFAGVCPETGILFMAKTPFETAAAAYDSTDGSAGSSHVAYDLALGRLEVGACCRLDPTILESRDTYDVTGVPDGMPVSCTAELQVDVTAVLVGDCGNLACGSVFGARLLHGGDADTLHAALGIVSGTGETQKELHATLQIPLTIMAGTPETLEHVLWTHRQVGTGGLDLTEVGRIRFSGLPAGVSVVSCRGFDLAVPVRRASWGSVKVRYR